MAFKIGSTNVSDITVRKNSEDISLTSVFAKKNGTTTQIWGKRSFTVTINNYSYLSSVSYSYKDAGGYTKSGNITATTTFNNVGYNENITITAVAKSATAQYTYSVSGTGTFDPSTSTATITGSRTTNKYTITLASTNGYWKNSGGTTITSIPNINYGTAISKSGTTLTVGSNTYTFNANSQTAQYTYENPTIGDVPATLTGNVTISGSATATLRSYTVSFTNPTYGSWGATSKTAYYGDTLSVSSYTVTCKQGSSSTTRWTNTCSANAQTAQYTYSLTGTVSAPASVDGAENITGPSSTRTERSYNVTFTNGTYGTWDSTTTISAPYSTAISLSGNTVTVGSTTRTYTIPDDTAQYDYGTTINGASGTVGTGKAITCTDTRAVKKYAVSITAGTGLSSAYLSTSSTATSGSASGTQYDYGTTVYAFVVLAEHYDVPADSNWVLVSGTMHETGSKYRVGSVTVSAAHNFGTFYAVIEKYNLLITKGTGISTIYYKVNGASSYASTTTNLSVSVNDLSTYYYYAVADSYHTANADCGSSSSPKSGTVNCADISTSVSSTAKTYNLVGTYTNGSVSWYSNSTMTTSITSAAYGSTVYYKYNASEGYSGSGSGSLTLNTTNFTISGTNATHNFGSAIRLTWNLSITKSNYMATVQYSIDGGTAVTVTSTTNLTGIDYASSVVVSGTKQSEAPYNYGAITGTGTFTYSATAQATTVACTRSVKEYTLTISTTNPSYGTYSVSRTSSPYKGASTGALSNGAKIYYGDVLTGTSSGNGTSYGAWNITSVTSPTFTTTGAATSGNLTVTNADSHTATLYYNTTSAVGGTSLGSTASGSSQTATGLSFNTTYYISARVSRSRDKYVDATDGTQYTGTDSVSGNVTASFKFKRTTTTDTGTIDSSVVSAKTAAQTTYTITFTRKSQPSSAIQTLGTAVTDTSIGVGSVVVEYGGSYSEIFSKTNYVSQTKSGSNVTADATVAVTLVPDIVNITQTDIANASETLNYAWAYKDASYTVTQTVTPSQGYDYTTGGVRYYNDNSYTRSITTPAATSFGSLTMNKFNYTVSGGTATNGTVAWSGGTQIGTNATWTITANSYYTRPSTYTGTKTINSTNFTLNEANKTAVYSGNLGTCTALNYTIQNYARTGGTVYWATSSITTSGGSTTLTAAYGTTVYWRIAASTGYNRPSTYYGSMTLNSTNFTLSSTTASGNATYKGSAISNCTRISGTLTQGTLPAGVASITCYRRAWDGSSYSVFTSGTIYYGDQFYWGATSSIGYDSPTVEYDTDGNTYFWTGSQGDSITSVEASGLQAGEKFKVINLAGTYTQWYYYDDDDNKMDINYIDYIKTGTVITKVSNTSISVLGTTYFAEAIDPTAQYQYTLGTISTTLPITVANSDVTITCNSTRTTRPYNVTVGFKYNTTTVATQTISVLYGTTISSGSYYPTSSSGYTYTSGNYTYTFKSGTAQSITVTGANQSVYTTYTSASYPISCNITIPTISGVSAGSIWYKWSDYNNWSMSKTATTYTRTKSGYPGSSSTIQWFITGNLNGTSYLVYTTSYNSPNSYKTQTIYSSTNLDTTISSTYIKTQTLSDSSSNGYWYSLTPIQIKNTTETLTIKKTVSYKSNTSTNLSAFTNVIDGHTSTTITSATSKYNYWIYDSLAGGLVNLYDYCKYYKNCMPYVWDDLNLTYENISNQSITYYNGSSSTTVKSFYGLRIKATPREEEGYSYGQDWDLYILWHNDSTYNVRILVRSGATNYYTQPTREIELYVGLRP